MEEEQYEKDVFNDLLGLFDKYEIGMEDRFKWLSAFSEHVKILGAHHD